MYTDWRLGSMLRKSRNREFNCLYWKECNSSTHCIGLYEDGLMSLGP